MSTIFFALLTVKSTQSLMSQQHINHILHKHCTCTSTFHGGQQGHCRCLCHCYFCVIPPTMQHQFLGATHMPLASLLVHNLLTVYKVLRMWWLNKSQLQPKHSLNLTEPGTLHVLCISFRATGYWPMGLTISIHFILIIGLILYQSQGRKLWFGKSPLPFFCT